MEWIAHCTVCGELDRAPNGAMMESLARIHRKDTGHMTIVGHEPSIIMSDKMVEVKIGEKKPRLFPETYGDWVNLAADIKDRYPDDPVMRATANAALAGILAEEQCSAGWSPEDAVEGRRWLTAKAGELGIR